MASTTLPADYFIKKHQFTQTVHRDQYPSIDPTSPKLLQRGKTIIVTGASQGIGKAIAIAFAKADAARIVIASRSASKLDITRQELLKVNPNVEVLIVPTDITSEDGVNNLEETIRSRFGVPDVLVNNVGVWTSTEIISESKPKEWWTDFEANVKGNYLVSRAFLRLVGLEREATIINVNSFGMLMVRPEGSSYYISKLALARLSEAVDSTYPKISSMNYHPGMIATNMAESRPGILHFCKDTVELAAGTAVYLALPQAHFLSGRYMSANWDVDELELRKDEIVKKDLLKIDLKGEFGSAVTSVPSFTTIVYPNKEGTKFNLDHFVSKHMPLAMKHWAQYGLKGYEITEFDTINGEKPQFSVQCIMKWEKSGCLEKALQSAETKIVFGDVPNFTSVPGVFMTGKVKGSG